MQTSDASSDAVPEPGAAGDAGRLRNLATRRDGRKAQQRRSSVRRLMNVARQQFIAKGYDAATVEEIAASVGMSKGAVYFYFKSKANLLLALLDEAEQLTVEPAVSAVAAAAAEGSACDQIVAFLHSQSLAGAEHADRMLLLILMSAELYGRGGELDERLRSIDDRMKRLLAGVVSEGKRTGVFTNEVPTAELVSVILAVNQGCYLEWYRRRGELRGEELARALRTVVLYGVLAPPAGDRHALTRTADEAWEQRNPAGKTRRL